MSDRSKTSSQCLSRADSPKTLYPSLSIRPHPTERGIPQRVNPTERLPAMKNLVCQFCLLLWWSSRDREREDGYVGTQHFLKKCQTDRSQTEAALPPSSHPCFCAMCSREWYFAVFAIVATSFTLVRGIGQVVCGLWLFSPANGEVRPDFSESKLTEDNGIYFTGIKGVAAVLLFYGIVTIVVSYFALRGIFQNNASFFSPWMTEESSFIVVIIIGVIEKSLEVYSLKILVPVIVILNIISLGIGFMYYRDLIIVKEIPDSQKRVSFKDVPEINIIPESSSPDSDITTPQAESHV